MLQKTEKLTINREGHKAPLPSDTLWTQYVHCDENSARICNYAEYHYLKNKDADNIENE